MNFKKHLQNEINKIKIQRTIKKTQKCLEITLLYHKPHDGKLFNYIHLRPSYKPLGTLKECQNAVTYRSISAVAFTYNQSHNIKAKVCLYVCLTKILV